MGVVMGSDVFCIAGIVVGGFVVFVASFGQGLMHNLVLTDSMMLLMVDLINLSSPLLY